MERTIVRLAVLGTLVIGAVGVPAWAQPAPFPYFEVADVPVSLAGTTYPPWQIVENDTGAYSVTASLPAPTRVDALHRLASGDWLLSVSFPTELGGTVWDPRDVFLWDGASVYSPYGPYVGAVAQVPEGSNVDAVYLDMTDPPGVVVSFDVPTTIDGVTYGPADLARYDGLTFEPSPLSFPGMPRGSNLTAADRRGLLIVFSLDVPSTVGSTTFFPGELISWDSRFLARFDPQPAWPSNRSRRVDALTFPPGAAPPPGTNPGDVGLLAVEKLGNGQLRLRWPPSDCEGGVNAGVYRGSLASLPAYDHTLIDCEDGFPYLQEDVAESAGDAYFLVVAHNGDEEGSYGVDGFGAQRPVGAGGSTCVPVQVFGCP